MHRRRFALIVAGLCAAPAMLAPRAHALSMSVTSANVNQAGESAQVCVVLSGGNGLVAGTQNDLVWDGNCASQSTPPNCKEAGNHRKPLAVDYPKNGADFSIRAILISFTDVDPIPDGPLYCCTFTVEASPGQCCPISVRNALGSNASGNQSLPASGNQGQLCTKSDSSGRGGGFNSPSLNQPLSASNAPSDAGAGNVPAPAANAPQGGGQARPPVSQVLPGGGAAPGSGPNGAAGVAPGGGSIEPGGAPTAAAAPVAAAPAIAATAVRPALPPPTAAATQATAAATARAAAPTPAATAAATAARSSGPAATPSRPRFAYTPMPSRRAGANSQQAAPPAAESSSWFGCQTVAGASAAPVLGIGAVAAVAALLRRRRGGRR